MAWLGPGKVLDRVTVVCDGGRIEWVGSTRLAPGADDELDVDGFLMPGAADRHVHIGLADPGAVLLGGVTAVRDLAWPPDVIFPLAGVSELPTFNGPLIRAAGPMITAPGGYPTAERWAPPGTGLEIRRAEEAAVAVEALADRGAAAIKVSLNAEAGPTPTDAELAAIIQAAGERGLPVTAHVQGVGQAERALGAGVSEFAHCPWSERLSESVLEAAAKAVRIVSTLDIWSFGNVTPELRTAADNMARFRAAGGVVVYGTDLGNGAIPPGIDVREILLLRETVGMTGDEILEALVAGPLESGGPADLIAPARDPREDLTALGDLKLVIRAGRVVTAA
jgi:imidazolonepropionase-like amidohydrolase